MNDANLAGFSEAWTGFENDYQGMVDETVKLLASGISTREVWSATILALLGHSTDPVSLAKMAAGAITVAAVNQFVQTAGGDDGKSE